ncbi:uncharacterized protein A1O5_13378 [Cladophialophora psammophila CBS 110553]|uniref:Xylanolytic transcriptional activator regulatory domain-containing protein n=1 Tax=Cladophialophora psammophila CBS 110553 TaxID=1182543 RepID=W9W490_9EURO|nr:uncharacterized protein A1O5_13378 [Cladophialophora psammophila CBS 110553]EXJ53389.1 hypothetical protein A1O5_13378 [Cladophialophora psammophila CBS 110553]
MDLNVDDLMFLEDSLFPDFHYDTNKLIPPLHQGHYANGEDNTPSGPRQILLSCTRQVTPSPEECNQQSHQQAQNVGGRVLRLPQEDVNTFEKNTLDIDNYGLISNFIFPSRIRMTRLLSAYFEYFDPHAPIVHRASFDVQKSHPALVLAMLAIGGLHVSEREFAVLAYEACSKLLYNVYPPTLVHPRTPTNMC